MHRIKDPNVKKEQEGHSSGSSYKTRRKKLGKHNKSGYQPDEWGYEHRGYPGNGYPGGGYPGGGYPGGAGGGVKIDRMNHVWDMQEPMAAPPRVLAPPDPGPCRYAFQPAPSYIPYTYPIALAVCQEPNFYQAPAAPVHLNPSVRLANHNSSRNHGGGGGGGGGAGDSKYPPSGRRHPRSSKYKPVQNSALSRSATHDMGHDCQPNSGNFNEYLSLPPGVQDACNDDAHRRFSDPGLGNPNSDTDSHRRDAANRDRDRAHASTDSESSLVDEWPPDTAGLGLVEQLKFLRADNKRLASELREARAELQQLKLHNSAWRHQKPEDYQPGMIADLVREVRDAARMREETLATRLRLMVSDSYSERLSASTSVHSVCGEVSGLQNNKKAVSLPLPDAEVAERLSRLEDQLEGLCIGKEKTEPLNSSVEHSRFQHVNDESNNKTPPETSDALKARKEAETNALKATKLGRPRWNLAADSEEGDGDDHDHEYDYDHSEMAFRRTQNGHVDADLDWATSLRTRSF